MQHRGTARTRVARVKLAGPAPAPGTPVLDRELSVGALGSSSGREALALAQARSRRRGAGGGPDIERGRRRPGARGVTQRRVGRVNAVATTLLQR